MEEKETKTVFVIMPFTKTPTRGKDDLDEFFSTNIKKAIESGDFRFRYVVNRSSDDYRINEAIIALIYTSDIMICDLSGEESNPNVMFELGIRLSVSSAPVILIREECENNRRIFDIAHHYIQLYSVKRYRQIEEFILKKIADYENDSFKFVSPVLEVLTDLPDIVARVNQNAQYRRLQVLQFAIHQRNRSRGSVAV